MGFESDISDLKYSRVGHLNLGRVCDQLANYAYKRLYGKLMPQRWQMLSQDNFVKTYGEGPKWSRAKNYSLFILNGRPLFRIWTRTNADFTWIDVDDSIASLLKKVTNVEDINEGNLQKCKPFTKTFAAKYYLHIDVLLDIVGELYGVEVR